MNRDLFRATPRDASASGQPQGAEPSRPEPAGTPLGTPSSNGAGHVGAADGAGTAERAALPAIEDTASGERAPHRRGDESAGRRSGGSGDRSRPDHPEPAGAGAAGGGDGLRVHLEFDFPSDVGYIERIVSVVIRQCEEFGFPPRQCALNVPVALSEALSNAILRGNGDDRSKQVRVRAHVDDRALVMEIADEGNGFDYDSCMRDPTAPENVAREDGRGLYLMQRLMDRVERYSDHGNVVRLTLQKRG